MIFSVHKLKNIQNKKILVRLDLNVPVKNGKVCDDTRIRESLPTLQFLLKKKARIIVVCHLGRPEGKRVRTLTVDPIVFSLQKLLKQKIIKLSDFKGKKVQEVVQEMNPGNIVVLENIRFSPEENDNRGTLAKELAQLADYFVQDGFSVCHRNDASIVGVPKYVPSFAGLQLEKEIKVLSTILKKPKHPFLVVIGGAKLETKVPVLQNLSSHADAILVAGGVANTLLHVLGYGVGDSIVDKKQISIAKKIARKSNVFVPLDVVVGNKKGTDWRVVPIERHPHVICKKGEAIFDVGPATIERLRISLPSAKTIVWNGALGLFEQSPYHMGTYAFARDLAACRTAFTVAGGGETIEILTALRLHSKISFVSTGGGAMLEFLSNKKLPGISVLERK